MAGRGGRPNCRAGIERPALPSGSFLDAGGVGTRCRNFEVGPRGAFAALGRQLSDAISDPMANAACRQSPVPEQRPPRTDCGGCGLSNRYSLQSRISARLWLAAGSLARQSIGARALSGRIRFPAARSPPPAPIALFDGYPSSSGRWRLRSAKHRLRAGWAFRPQPNYAEGRARCGASLTCAEATPRSTHGIRFPQPVDHALHWLRRSALPSRSVRAYANRLLRSKPLP